MSTSALIVLFALVSASASRHEKTVDMTMLPGGTQTVGYNKFVEGRTRPGRTAADSYGKAGRDPIPGSGAKWGTGDRDAYHAGDTECTTTIDCNSANVKVRASSEFCSILVSNNGEKVSCIPDRERACKHYNDIVFEVNNANAADAGYMHGFAKGGLVMWKKNEVESTISQRVVGEVSGFTFHPERLHDGIPVVKIDVKFPHPDKAEKSSKTYEIYPWELTVVDDNDCFSAVRFAVERNGATMVKSHKCKCPEGLFVVPKSSSSNEMCNTPDVRTFASGDFINMECQCGLAKA